MMRGFGIFGAWGWVGMILNLVIFAVILICVIWLIVAAIRRGNTAQTNISPQVPAPPASSTPKDIVQARYARGEINRDEYQQLMTDLSK